MATQTFEQALRDIIQEYGDTVLLRDNAGIDWQPENLLEACEEYARTYGREGLDEIVVRIENEPRHEVIQRVDERGSIMTNTEPLYVMRPFTPKPEPVQRPGRPRVHQEPRHDLYLRLPVSLMERMDALTDNRTAWIAEAIRQRLEREEHNAQ